MCVAGRESVQFCSVHILKSPAGVVNRKRNFSFVEGEYKATSTVQITKILYIKSHTCTILVLEVFFTLVLKCMQLIYVTIRCNAFHFPLHWIVHNVDTKLSSLSGI